MAGQEGGGVNGGPIGQRRPHLDQPVRVLGAPLLWLWLLGAWAAVIALVAVAVRDP